MVATLVALRLRILGHALRRDTWRLVILVLGAVWALGTLPAVLGGTAWLAGQAVDVRHDVLVIAGAVIVVGWAAVPVLVFGMDEALDPSRFATFGMRLRSLLPGLLVAGVLSVPALFTGLLCLAPVLVWSSAGTGAALAALAAAPLALVTCMLTGRIATSAAARLLGSRRSRELGAVSGVLTLALVVPIVLRLGSLGLEGALQGVPRLAHVLGWTPVGLLWAAPASAAAGDWPAVLARFALAGAWLLLGVWTWAVLVRRALVRPPSRGGIVRRHRDRILRDQARGAQAGSTRRWTRSTTNRRELAAALAIAARAWRYWLTDPRYLSAMVATFVLPLLIVLLLGGVMGLPVALVLGLGPLVAGTIGWGRHNDVAYDGTAFWLHVASAVPGRVDRAGRILGALLWSVPLLVLVSVGATAWTGRWELLPATLGTSVGVLAAGLAVSAVCSAVLPYPVPPPGASPFAAETGAAGASMAAQFVASAATAVVAAPLLALFGAALWWRSWVGWPALALGLVGGAAVLWIGVVVGGRVYDTRAVRVLARLG